MLTTDTQEIESDLFAKLFSDEAFWPTAPRTIEDTGLSVMFVEALICKFLATTGTASGRRIAEELCLPFGTLEDLFGTLRTRQLLVHAGAAPFNDYYYSLTEQGNSMAESAAHACGYAGPAPVPLMDYVISVEA